MASAKTQTKARTMGDFNQEQARLQNEAQQSPGLPAVQHDQLPAELMEEATQHEGLGLSTDQADNLVPLVYLLQSNSPQVKRGHEKNIQGAQDGDIWLRANQPGDDIIKGDAGMLFQPCFFSKDWVEWLPNRGGFVRRHDDKPAVAVQKEIKTDDGRLVNHWVMPNGNLVIETRYHIGYAYMPDGRVFPYTIPLSSTGHTFSKSWMFTMNSQAMPNGKKAPMCLRIYRLTPKLQRKGQFSWHQYTATVERWANMEEYRRGIALHEAFASGEKEIAEETADYVDEGQAAQFSDSNFDPAAYEGDI